MGKRSRKRRAVPSPAPAPRVSRSEARNAEVRAQLEPLEQGERPTAVTVGAAIATVLAVGNVVLGAGEAPVPDERASLEAVSELVAAGVSRRQAADVVARLTGASRNALYRRTL